MSSSESRPSGSRSSGKTTGRTMVNDFVQDKLEANQRRKSITEIRLLKRTDNAAVMIVRLICMTIGTRKEAGSELVLQDESGVITIVCDQKWTQVIKHLQPGSFYKCSKFIVKAGSQNVFLAYGPETEIALFDLPPNIQEVFTGQPLWTRISGVTTESTKSLIYPNICGRIMSISPNSRTIEYNGKQAKVREVTIKDESGEISVSLFNAQADIVPQPGHVIGILNGQVKKYGKLSVSAFLLWNDHYDMPMLKKLGEDKDTAIQARGPQVNQKVFNTVQLQDIKELKDTTIGGGYHVQFEASLYRFLNLDSAFYFGCKKPQCGKRLKDGAKGMLCSCGAKYASKDYSKNELKKFIFKATLASGDSRQDVGIWENAMNAALIASRQPDNLDIFKQGPDADRTLFDVVSPLVDMDFSFKAVVRRNGEYVNVDILEMNPVMDDLTDSGFLGTPAKRKHDELGLSDDEEQVKFPRK